MRKVKYRYLPFLMLAINPSISFASDTKDIDPGDMTQVYTQVGGGIDSDSNIKVLGSVSGTHSGGDKFLLYGEMVFGDAHFHDEDYGVAYNNARFQYFQVTDTSLSLFPKVGFSMDLIHSKLPELDRLKDDMTLGSVGVVGMINPTYTGSFMIFPNLAYTYGEMYGKDVDGYMANLFLTRRISDNRSYVGFFPEYMSISGDGIERQSLTLKFQVGTPITDSGRFWMTVTYEHQESNLVFNSIDNGWKNSSSMELGFKYYL